MESLLVEQNLVMHLRRSSGPGREARMRKCYSIDRDISDEGSEEAQGRAMRIFLAVARTKASSQLTPLADFGKPSFETQS